MDPNIVGGPDAGEILLLLLAATLVKYPILGAVLALMASPAFALIARWIVRLTPAKWDDVGLEWLLTALKAFAGVIPPEKSK